MRTNYYVVVVDDLNIEAVSLERANEIYATFEHARIERWNLKWGTARTIKEK